MSTRKLRSAGGAAFALTLTAGVVAILAEQAAVAADLTVTAPRQAELLSERVSIAGLDLGRDQDRRLLDRRLRAASARVCAPVSVGFPATPENRCRSATLRDASQQVARLAASGSRMATTIVVSATQG